VEFTKEQLDNSLANLKNLEKSLEASQSGELLKKSDPNAENNQKQEEGSDNGSGEKDLNKSGAANQLEGDKFGPQYSGTEGGHASERKDESYEKGGDKDMSKMSDEEKKKYMEKMKKMGGHDDMKKAKDMEKMKYSHADEEGEEENSLLKSFSENGELKKAVDVSSFLKSFLERNCEHLQNVDNRLEKSFVHLLETNQTQNVVIAKLADNLETMQKSLDQITTGAIAGPKSFGINGGVNAIQRNQGDLNKSMNENQNRNPDIMKKSILNSMMLDVEKKAYPIENLIKFEATNEISEQDLAHYGKR